MASIIKHTIKSICLELFNRDVCWYSFYLLTIILYESGVCVIETISTWEILTTYLDSQLFEQWTKSSKTTTQQRSTSISNFIVSVGISESWDESSVYPSDECFFNQAPGSWYVICVRLCGVSFIIWTLKNSNWKMYDSITQ